MLNPKSPLPLYHQLAEILAKRIRSGELPPGNRIPSEHQLADSFGIGRPTVRQAIDSLVRKGLVFKKRGSGTYVKPPPKEIDLFSLDGTGASFHKKGLKITTRIIDPVKFQQIEEKGTPYSGGQAWFLSRLTLAEGVPVLLEDLFLHPDLFPGIDKISLEGVSLSEVAKETFFLQSVGGRQSFHINYLDSRRGNLLQVNSDTPILRVDRTIDFSQAQEGFFSRLYCRTDQFVFSQNLDLLVHGE